MRIVVAGGGSVGTFIGDELAGAGHEVVVVERDPSRVAKAGDATSGARWICADACELSELRRADPATADVVVAVTGDDEDNLVISLLSKQEFAVPRVIARVNNPQNEWLFTDMWGVDLAVST
ncbi:MAG: TrkA family potassium uptake protein, partial [Acidimicrobiales bacterium]|nr:TrkA family potassium uptake protein [Acidimicrobiales bacterium]